jgi:23S rRNA (cytidine1920-2'-O)/16S rRNA (cytidine1409-2'-O)-methyltransferase
MVERGTVPTRTKAQALILAGRVLVDGIAVSKVGASVRLDSSVEIAPGPRFVSRGGEKLEGALDDFKVDPQGLVCIDIGASTGGFTDCLLQRGAAKVFAVDVGRAQLAQSLREDPRVVNLEETHLLRLDASKITETPALAVIDVSFISLKPLLARVRELIRPGGTALPMVKPQFEVGPKFLKKGVVRTDEARDRAVSEVEEAARAAGFETLGRAPARLKGPKGNQEFFLHLRSKHGEL